MKNIEEKITEADLEVFPPGLWSFLVVTFLLMIGHVSAGLIFLYYFLSLGPASLIPPLLLSGMLIVVFNIALIRGRLWAQNGIKALAIIYGVTALVGWSGVLSDINAFVSGCALATSILSLAVIASPFYKEFCDFFERRWRLYRQTGKTILELYSEQQKQK